MLRPPPSPRPTAPPGDAGAAGLVLEPSGTSADLQAIWGSSQGDVYVVGTQGTILHRTDSWRATTTSAASDLTAVWGSDPDAVYIGSLVPGRGGNAPILRSTDRGASWIVASGTGYNWVSALWGSSAGDVWIGLEGAGPAARLVRSIDRLSTTIPSGLEVPSSSHVVALGGDASHVLALRADGQLGRSTDRASWTLVPVPIGTVAGMAVLGNEVFVVASGGAVARSNDFGASFTVVPSGLDGARAIWAASPTDLYICGAAGALARSRDAGLTFQRLPVPTHADLNALWSSAPGDLYVVGASGTILHGEP